MQGIFPLYDSAGVRCHTPENGRHGRTSTVVALVVRATIAKRREHIVVLLVMIVDLVGFGAPLLAVRLDLTADIAVVDIERALGAMGVLSYLIGTAANVPALAVHL